MKNLNKIIGIYKISDLRCWIVTYYRENDEYLLKVAANSFLF